MIKKLLTNIRRVSKMAEKKPSPKKPVVVRKITKVTRPMRKSVVKNPSAPKATGSGTTVKPITKSETFMKKGKAKGSNAGGAKGAAVPKGPTWPSSVPDKYKTKRGSLLSYMDEQTLRKKGYQSEEGKAKTREQMRSTQSKTGKPSGKMAPKKAAPAPKQKQKPRIFVGRGGGMRGGVSGTLDSQIK
jgi:hypothetical protein